MMTDDTRLRISIRINGNKNNRQNYSININYHNVNRISNNDRAFDMRTIFIWMTVSKCLTLFVIVIAVVTFPLLCYSLKRVYRWRASPSNYSLYLTAIIIGDLFLFAGICLSLCLVYFELKGALMCKWTMLLVDVTACFVNWVWVLMFVQRFVLVFYPIRTMTWTCLHEDNRRMLVATLIMSFGTQVWTALLTTENTFESHLEASFCDLDRSLVHPQVYKWIALAESMFTYAIPFAITVFADMAVLLFRTGSPLLVIMSESLQLKAMNNNNNNNDLFIINGRRQTKRTISATTLLSSISHRDHNGVKIQSRNSIMIRNRRRKRAIHRCLIMTTVNLLLNLPNYILQLCDEFVELRFSHDNSVFYIYADAIAYLLYLSQFPLIALYVHCLSWDVIVDRRRQRSISQQSSKTTQ